LLASVTTPTIIPVLVDCAKAGPADTPNTKARAKTQKRNAAATRSNRKELRIENLPPQSRIF
jgi:hypothetical protein